MVPVSGNVAIKSKGVRVNCAKANKAEASPGTSHSMYPAIHSISRRYDEVVLLPLGRLNRAQSARPNPPPYVRSVRKRKRLRLRFRVNGGNTPVSYPRLFPEYLTRPATGNCSNFAHIKIRGKLPATFRTGFAHIFSFQEEGEGARRQVRVRHRVTSPPTSPLRELARQPCNERGSWFSRIEGTKGGELCGELSVRVSLSPHWKTWSWLRYEF